MTVLPIRFIAASAVAFLTLAVPSASALAQVATPSQPKPRPDPYGSPLDTIMSTHLWADVPPARDFVKTSRPNPEKLDYAPLTGQDPPRPKPRDAAGVASLQAELEKGGASNEVRAKGLRGTKSTVRAARPGAKRSAATNRLLRTSSGAAP
jgi:hypothetical protein